MTESATKVGSSPGSKRILVVEDHPDNRALACKVLRRAGFETAETDRAEGLRELVAAHRPDLILMDIELPGSNGYEAVQLLRADPEMVRVPVIALTAYAMEEDKQKCLRAGCTDYLSKPLDIALLVETVRKHLLD
jgi:two-component system cell cycle response regulator DivK